MTPRRNVGHRVTPAAAPAVQVVRERVQARGVAGPLHPTFYGLAYMVAKGVPLNRRWYAIKYIGTASWW